MVSNHKNIKIIRQKILDAFHDKTPILLAKLVPGKDLFFFNAYSVISPASDAIGFDLNDADAVRLADIDDDGLVTSVVGQIKFTSEETCQVYTKQGKNRQDRMREGIFSDGTRTLKITIWADLLEIVKEFQLIQIANASTKTFNEELVLTTNYSTIICFLTEALDVQFDESVAQKDSTATPPKEMIVCCPVIESIVVKTFLQCKICKGKVDIRPGTGLATCTNVHCGRDFSVTHLKQQPNCCQICVVLDMRNEYVALTVTAYREVLEEYFGEEIADEVKLRSDLLNLTDVDFVITKGQKVSKMTMHKK